MKALLLSAVLASTLLTGCVVSIDDDYKRSSRSVDWRDVERDNRANIAKLDAGVSISMVRKMMGVPDFDELVVKDGVEHRVLYYRTQLVRGDDKTTKSECTPLVFVDNELTGFGETALKHI